MRFVIWLSVLWTLFAGFAAAAEDASTFFDDNTVKEIRLHFSDTNWYNTLNNAHKNDSADPFFPAEFSYSGTTLTSIGVRFKGNSSFSASNTKKSFKLDFNKYDPNATFLGMTKLNLNNQYLVPDFLREKMFLDFASKYIAAMRAVHCRVYVNDVYWGLYLAVEQPDKAMMQDRFGKHEDGNLYKTADNGYSADLTYHGTDQASYYANYVLETNTTENDWSDLVNFIDILNNTATANLPSRLEPILDVDNIMRAMALNSLFADVESYGGSASEYFLYHRDDTGRFVFLQWDLNECLGMTIYSTPKVLPNPMDMDPFWLPDPSKYGSRPLLTNLWAIDSYKKKYLRHLARMLREGFDGTTMSARITQLADLIRTDVYNDTKKMYTNANFETNLTNPVKISSLGTQVTVYGVQQFVQQRYNYLKTKLQTYANTSDIRLNELMSVNASTLADEAGDFDPWIEMYNQGPGTLSTSGFYLTDTTGNPTKWALPVRSLADGASQILWLDNETGEGADHVNFRLNASGGNLYLYYVSGSTLLIDSISYPALRSDQSLIRMNNAGSQWLATNVPTPGAENPDRGTNPWGDAALLRINELMAVNNSYLEDPGHPGSYPDWFEIYNPGSATVNMSGMFMTDDMNNPTQWQVPSGVTIAPGGYLIFWADSDPEQGNTHTSFKLGSGGGALAVFGTDGFTLIDAVVFPAQTANASYGRERNLVNEWTYYDNPINPTPGAANGFPSSATLAIAAGEAGTVSTNGASEGVQTGYAAVSANSGAQPYGVAIYSYSQGDTIVTEAGVPASPPTQWARVFIDFRSGVEALPGQGAGTIDIFTGIAIANTSTKDATLFFTLRKLNGEYVASGYGTLPAGTHDARFVDQLGEIAPGFVFPSDFATATRFGTLEISSDQAVSITALRMSINQRGDPLFTTTPIADLSAPLTTSPLYFPQMANGGGYVTTVMLINTSSYPENGTLYLYNDSGSALTVTNTAGVPGSSFAYSIPVNGSWVLETNGLSGSLNVGSMQIVPSSGNAPVGAGVFRYTFDNITVTEAGIPSASATTHARIYIDKTAGRNTGVALAAINATAVSISAHAYALDGSTPAGGSGTINLSGNGHKALFASEIISGLEDGFVGVLDVQAPTPFAALTLRSLMNNRGDFLMTMLPLADLTRPAPSPIVFPQICDGGGYTTQFILLSAGEAVQSSVSLLNKDGSFSGVIP